VYSSRRGQRVVVGPRELRDGLVRAVRLDERCIAAPVVQIAMSTAVGFGGPRRFARPPSTSKIIGSYTPMTSLQRRHRGGPFIHASGWK